MRIAGAQASGRWLVPEVVQTSAMDCGPASLKCLLEGFGIPVSYGRLREACQTDIDGTSIDTIEAVANRLGIDAEQILVPVDHLFLPQAQVLPAIVVVRQADGATHFVVVWRRHGAWLQVMDPAIGRRWVRSRRFAEEVFQHQAGVPAREWRVWAGSDDFLLPLRAQLRGIGVPAATTEALLARALAEPLWFALAALEASVRFVRSVVDAGGLEIGQQAGQLTATMFEQTLLLPHDIHGLVAPAYWSALPGTFDAYTGLQLRLQGAVLVRITGRKNASNGEGAKSGEAAGAPLRAAERSPELAAALAEKPVHPLRTIWALLAVDGVLAPLALAVAMAIAAAAVLVETFLFRGLFDIGWALNLPSQRLGAVAALLAFVFLLMLLEIPIFTETMRLGRHLEIRLRVAWLKKLPYLGDRYFQSRPVSDMADRSHNIYLTRMLPGFGLHFVQALCDLAFTLAGVALIDSAALGPATLLVLAALVIPVAVQPLLNERDLRIRNHGAALHVF